LKLESKIQSEILNYLKSRVNSFTYKHFEYPTGMPDIHHIDNGYHYWFEVKRSKKHKPTKIQQYIHKQLKNAGDKVFVVWSVEQVIRILNPP